MKKIISVLLTCIMILTMIPAAAFADDAKTISQIDITFDLKMDTSLTEGEIQNNINASSKCAQSEVDFAYKILLLYWKKGNLNGTSDGTSSYSETKKYLLEIRMEPKEGYSLPDDPKSVAITVNGEKYVPDEITLSTELNEIQFYYYPESERNKITDVTGTYTAPKPGRKPSYTATTDSSDYTAVVSKWYNSSNMTSPSNELSSDDVFKPGEYYICELKVTPAEGKTFAIRYSNFNEFKGSGYVVSSMSTKDVAYIRFFAQCPDYTVNISGGTASSTPAPGNPVTITATVPEGKVFDKWVSSNANIIFADAASATTTFIMPESDVEITAQFKDKEEEPAVPADPGTAKNIADMTIKLSASSLTYNGAYRKPVVTATDSGMVLVKDTDYTVSYSNNKYVGTAKVTITGIGAYAGTVVKTFKINPTKVTVSSVKKAASGKMKVTWKKHSTQTTGFQVQYSTYSTFKSAKTVTVSGSKATTKTISKLKKGKKYYVRVRSYKTVNGTKYYSSWSAKKSVRV